LWLTAARTGLSTFSCVALLKPSLVFVSVTLPTRHRIYLSKPAQAMTGISHRDPVPEALVERFSYELEMRQGPEPESEPYEQLRSDFIEDRRRKEKERRDEIERIRAQLASTRLVTDMNLSIIVYSTTSRGLLLTINRPNDETLFNKTRQGLMLSMKNFQALVPDHLKTTSLPTRWEDVELTLSEVQAQWESKNRDSNFGRVKQWTRKMCDGLNNHSNALAMLPAGSEYVSLVAGAVTMIIKV
jgi:hypothetical protein